MILNTHHIKVKSKIFTTNLNSSDNELSTLIDETYKLGDSMNKATNVQAAMSTYKIFNETQIFTDVLKKILKLIKGLGLITDPRYEMVIVDAWTASYKKGDNTKLHHHTPAHTSFVYYLNDTDPITPLSFPDAGFYHYPKKDDLIIFPSHLNHFVPAHQSDTERVVLAGNVDLMPIKEIRKDIIHNN